jgi:hypothetical protein
VVAQNPVKAISARCRQFISLFLGRQSGANNEL